jgi:hypothetical protein
VVLSPSLTRASDGDGQPLAFLISVLTAVIVFVVPDSATS